MQIDSAALQRDLEALAQYGADAGGGVTRLAYGDAWLAGRRWLQAQMESLGMAVSTDAAGNLIGTFPGENARLPPLATGSHTDTVMQGGLFDGALGVLAGLAVVRALQTSGRRLQHPVAVIDFACEEATYGGGVLGSQAMAGQWRPALLDEPDPSGVTIADRLRGAGIQPERVAEAARQPGSVAAFLELHIEQGARLEAAGIPIGIVEGIVGIRRFRTTFTGDANHAGTTPMGLRNDALVAASRFVLAVQQEAVAQGDPNVATVGQLQAFPGSPNVIPGRVELTVEIRGQHDHELDELEARLRERARPAVLQPVQQKAPVPMAKTVLAVLADACCASALPYQGMVSGAGHDAMCMAAIAPSAMIFVPSRGGISHSPLEWTDWAACACGAQVLLEALVRLDGGQEA